MKLKYGIEAGPSLDSFTPLHTAGELRCSNDAATIQSSITVLLVEIDCKFGRGGRGGGSWVCSSVAMNGTNRSGSARKFSWVQVANGLIWVYGSCESGAEEEAAKSVPKSLLNSEYDDHGYDGFRLPWYQRNLPYSAETLLENVSIPLLFLLSPEGSPPPPPVPPEDLPPALNGCQADVHHADVLRSQSLVCLMPFLH